MTTIDERGRRAGAAARADAADLAATRVELGLERLRLDDGPVVGPTPRRRIDPRRWITIGVAAALAAAAIVALVVNANEGESHRLVPAEPSTELTSPSTAVATTNLPSTTAAPETTTAPAVIPAETIAVSYDALPPAFPAKAFLGMTDQTEVPYLAIGDTHIVMLNKDASTAVLIDPISPSDTPPAPVQLDVKPTGLIAAGPGDVLYAVVQGDGIDASLDAIALSGDRAGQVVGSAPINIVEYAETPSEILGHGPDGIIDRRTGETLLEYVDVTGAPTSLGRPAHTVGPILGDVASDDLVVRDPDGKHDWHLATHRDPTSPGFFNGEAPPAPSSHGGAVVWTAIGPPDNPSSDTPSPTEPVVAVLAADGTGRWYSLADGWQVGASDLDGTILVRLHDSTVELARLDPPQRYDFLNQPAAPHQRLAFAETLPSSLATAAPCTTSDLEIIPSAEGAAGTTFGILNVRNKSDKPCEVSGVPNVALLDPVGNVVQSTDPGLLGQSGAQPIVLEPDSWASALLGAIANNVCGGGESAQISFTIGTDVLAAVAPFSVGGPPDPSACAASEVPTVVPGVLQVQPFAPIEASGASTFSADGLAITIEAPATVEVGDVLKYDVVLAAGSDPFFVDGSNCAIYTEALGAATAQLQLNCNGRDGILVGSGESVRFHIELPIPADAAVGPAALFWTPIEPAGDAVTAPITIVA
jgi:hypothetical protein